MVVRNQLLQGFLTTSVVAILFYKARCYNELTAKAEDGGAKGAKMQNLGRR